MVGLVAVGLAGCSGDPLWPKRSAETAEIAPLPEGIVRPVARPDDRSASLGETANDAPVAQAKGSLGTTIVSLGTPTEPGLWIKTPLVKGPGKGRVSFRGKTIDVKLIAIEGEASAGSRLSMQAMQALGIPLTDLAEVQVLAI
ncbi:hypothetical protein SAMN05444000_11159 [Shimia gijangensis]|uniref:Uncharacterized protein n=2 Tax=Shimia gijangensis TaxID=1470563 RepID=A0A1M6L2B7_9RHOB|nr:hypothetical protein SAMN05444000_11159 [Shimia gijangensis]